VIFDEAYYVSDLPKGDYPHYTDRATWIQANYGGKRVIELGCGFGHVIKALRDSGIVAWGVDLSQHAFDNTVAPGFIFLSSAQDYKNQLRNQDFVISWNFLDCMTDEAEAELVGDALARPTTQYHVICVDDGSQQAQDYKDRGYFIMPVSYWLNLLRSDAVIVEYHSRIVHNHTGELLMPLSWAFVSL
jgi:SAM-dependent methyltransferase